MAEATAQLKKGLELLTRFPDSASRHRQELELQIVLGQVLIATQGYAAPVVGETYARARALCEQLDRPPQIVPVIYGQGVHHLLKGPLRIAQEIAANLLQLGEETGNAALTNVAHGLSGSTYFQLGEFLTSRAHSEKAVGEFDPKDRPFFMSLAAQDRKVTHLAYLSCDLLCLGYFDQARLRSEAAISRRPARLDHPYSLAHALTMAWMVDWATRSDEKLRARADEVIAVSRGARLSLLIARGRLPARMGTDRERPNRGGYCVGTGWSGRIPRDRSAGLFALCSHSTRRCREPREAVGTRAGSSCRGGAAGGRDWG